MVRLWTFVIGLLLGSLSGVGAEGAVAAPCPRYFSMSKAGLCVLQAPYMMGGEGRAWMRLPDAPVYRQGLSPKQIALGQLLFFDPLLSGDGKRACASCHEPRRDFTDGLAQSQGRDGLPLARSSMTLWNVGFLDSFLWDGRVATLEAQAEGPLFDPREMSQTPAGLLAALNGNDIYRQLFADAFADATAGIEVRHVAAALATFERTLISFNSPYDRYAHGDLAALSPRQLAGFNIFRSFITRCSECHTPPLFTNGQMAIIGVPDGVTPGQALRVPTLRNIARTAPYTHAGTFGTLAEVVRFYDRGGGRANGDQPKDLHWHIRPIGLSAGEQADLVTFLEALSDTDVSAPPPPAVPSGLPVGGG